MRKSQAEEWRQSHIEKVMQDLGLTRKEYKRFLILGNKLNKIYTMACNGFTGNESIYYGNVLVNRYELEDEERDSKPLIEKAQAMAKEKGLHIFFQTDPRGATIYLDKKPIEYDRYTDAYCIY